MEHEYAVFNEWGRLREVFVGIVDENYVEPEYIPEFAWMSKEKIEFLKRNGGKRSVDVCPEDFNRAREQADRHADLLRDLGVKVHRNIPLESEEEKHFLDYAQKGAVYNGGADFFRVIGDNIILLNNLRYPFRRKQVWTVWPVLEPLLEGRSNRYTSLPPLSLPAKRSSDLFASSPENDIYLENGDIQVDGYNVYVGISGLATNLKGMNWLAQFLGPEYHVHFIPLAGNVLHLDTVMMLNRPGLLTYYPELVRGLPEPLKDWDKIEVRHESGEEVDFGANSLSVDIDTIILAEEYRRLKPAYEGRGMDVIMEPMQESMLYGSGPRCLTGVLSRDS